MSSEYREVSREAEPVSGTRVLVVDDEALFAKAITRRLERAGYACASAGRLGEARARLAEREPDVVLLDIRLPDGSGLDLLREIRSVSKVPVLVMTAYGEVEDAVNAMKDGASDYLKKPIDLDELLLNVEKVLGQREVDRRLEYSQTREHVHGRAAELVGVSPVLVGVREQALKIAALAGPGAAPPTVLITGETGTGKDVTARLIHGHSARAGQPFVHVDCAALPKDLFESELFGHVKGAFTHAVAERTGLIEAAEDGVVFLDEIGEIPLELQSKLLAVLERRTLRRIGSSHERHTAAWFIAATNRDVEEMVAAGALRSDLYFRLNVLSLALPALRERGDDVALLAARFAADTARRYGLPEAGFEPGALRALSGYAWPGNVRELAHLVERAVLLSQGKAIDESLLNLPGGAAPPAPADALAALDGLTLEEVEKRLIARALAASGDNVSEAARRLGLTRMAMRYRMQKHAISTGN
ncbi:MAG: sigma-54-dependent Fis family transcriptional regulator [Gammaproteobacteria bacterium]|nr:sigma-54-dependent Fis family transcriptional regulator [Gammaproteobacteria bacterium]